MAATTTPATTLEAPKSLLDIFPPVRKSHILHCSFPFWHGLFRAHTPKARTIPLTGPFLSYLREDGIILPDDEEALTTLSESSASDSDSDSDSGSGEAEQQDRRNPTQRFPELHEQIKSTIRELGGRVAPKLDWSAPKDAAFMAAANTMECRTPGEVYLLLKSSDFVTHDLEHAFDDCVDDDDDDGDDTTNSEDEGEAGAAGEQKEKKEKEKKPLTQESIPYHLALRKWFPLNPSLEFRVFVSARRILAISQRDLNHYDFLPGLRATLVTAITRFHERVFSGGVFPDPDYVLDVYVPLSTIDEAGGGEEARVWLVDVNPFAPRTDAVLFSWVEILRLRNGEGGGEGRGVELRLVERGDPEAYQFATPQYGASKLPREVVEVGLEGEEAVWQFARRWREVVDKAEREREVRQVAAGRSGQ